jgi:hypothetical protein
MAKPYNTEIIKQKNSISESDYRSLSNVNKTIVKGFVRNHKISSGSSKVIDDKDMRYWKEFDYFPGILIGVMRRWENGNR